MSGANNNSTLHSPHSTLVTTPEQLVQIYINAEKKLTDIIQAKARASSPAAYERSLLKQIDDELRKLRVTSAKGVTELIEHFYESGLQQLVEQLASIGENRTYNMFSRLNRRQIEIIARNTNGDFNKAIKMIGRRTQDTVRKITLESTAEKLTTGQTIRQMQKSLAKAFENEHLTCVEYSNGAKMPISKYAEMTARSTTAEAQNSSQFVQAKDWGYDLVKMTFHSPTCAVCAKYQGRVYATTKDAANGKYKDKDGKRLKFPYLYDTVLVKGYDTVHPNCRHRFSIYPARAYTTEELKKASQNSMREFTDDRSDDERKAYAKEQAEKRRKNENLKQYEKLKAMFPDDAPKSFAGFVRMKNAKSERYKQLINDSRTITRLANERENGIINEKRISGALNSNSPRAEKHAIRYYESVRHMTTDVSKISKNTGFAENEIAEIKDFIFMQKHKLGDKYDYFAPDFMMAQSWQRLIDGKNIQPHDLTLLNHEKMERELMRKGLSQSEAHIITSKTYNYSKEAQEYHDKINEHTKK